MAISDVNHDVPGRWYPEGCGVLPQSYIQALTSLSHITFSTGERNFVHHVTRNIISYDVQANVVQTCPKIQIYYISTTVARALLTAIKLNWSQFETSA